MKKLLPVVFVTLIAMSVFSAAVLADDNETENETNTLKEVKIMADQRGAGVRLLQLENRIERNIIFGEAVIEKIKENNVSFDTTQLEALLEELKALKEEVTGINTSTINKTEAVRLFVDLKKDAIDICQQFREMARTAFSENEIETFRERTETRVRVRMGEMNQKLKEAIREYNGEHIAEVLGDIGQQNQELIDRIKNGEISPGGIKSELAKMISQLNREMKRSAVMKMAEKESRDAVNARQAWEKAKNNYLERKTERLRERLQNLEEKNANLTEKLRDRYGIAAEGAGNGRGR